MVALTANVNVESFPRKVLVTTTIMTLILFMVMWVSMMVNPLSFLEVHLGRVTYLAGGIALVLGFLLSLKLFFKSFLDVICPLLLSVAATIVLTAINPVEDRILWILIGVFLSTAFMAKGYVFAVIAGLGFTVAILITAPIGCLVFLVGVAIARLVDLGLKLHQRRKDG